jgi:hypothetical protein
MQLARLGWMAGPGVVLFPLWDHQQRLVNVKVRPPRQGKDKQMRTWPTAGRVRAVDGEAFPLFPWIPKGPDVVLCAGELDALALLSVGLPACSVTAGAGGWREEYASLLRDKRVTVLFDRGEEANAEYAAGQLPNVRRVHVWPSNRQRGYDATKFLLDGGNPQELT